MILQGFSTRSKVLYCLQTVLGTVGLAVVLALLISLGGYFIAGWEDAPVNQMIAALVDWAIFGIPPTIALRLALAWSRKKDRLAQA